MFGESATETQYCHAGETGSVTLHNCVDEVLGLIRTFFLMAEDNWMVNPCHVKEYAETPGSFIANTYF